MTPPAPKIAILGFDLEANRFAPPCGRADFEERAYFEGDAISAEARSQHPAIHGGICGFYAAMDLGASWTPAPVLFTGSTPAGPVEQAFFDEVLASIRAGLAAAMPVDGVYICEHGAAISSEDHDPDGALFAAVRAIVGPDVPVVATLDLHANMSRRMVDATDLMIGYRSNPHVDQHERGAEAASAMLEMLAGVRPRTAWVRLPLVAPSVTQLTAAGHPYGDLIRLGQGKVSDEILNVTILSGFAFSDTPKNGMSIVVAARTDPAAARATARELAIAAWADRERYQTNMMSLDAASALARGLCDDRARPSLLFCDPADNPGGGGRGNTTYILKAFHEAGLDGVAFGVQWDPALVAQAFAAGEGVGFTATFNAGVDDRNAETFTAGATVLRLSEGELVCRHGMAAGKTVRLGPACALAIGGLTAVVISHRQQCLSADYFEHFGVDVAALRCCVVKSRGHFRAGFAHLFPPERIHEIDVPGLTSPNLANFDWRHLPRPVYPLDPETAWSPDEIGKREMP